MALNLLIYTYGLPHSSISFKLDNLDGNCWSLEIPDIKVVYRIPTDAEDRKDIALFPSILGLDILAKFKISFPNSLVLLEVV